MNRRWLAFRSFNVVPFDYNFRFVNVNSRWSANPVTSNVIRLKFDGQMFQPDETRNNELLVDIGWRGHFPPSERIDLGTHYDLIDHLWQKLNSYLDHDCRWIVGFRPALVHPQTGVAFAIAIGTNYFVRITENARQEYFVDLHAKALTDAERVGVAPSDLDHYLSYRTGESDIGLSWATDHFLPNEDRYILRAYNDVG